MKRILLILSLSATAGAVAFHFIASGAFRTGALNPIPAIVESTQPQAIPIVEDGESAGPQGSESNPSDPIEIASGFSSTDPPSGSWRIEPVRPLDDSHRVAQAITSLQQQNPSVITGWTMLDMGGGWSGFGSGGLSAVGGGGGGSSPSDPLQTGPSSSPLQWEGDPPPVVFDFIPETDPPNIAPLKATAAVPEPGTILLLGAGLGSLLWIRRRSKT